MSGAASPYDLDVYKAPRQRKHRGKPKLMERATGWQPRRLNALDLPHERTDHGPFVDERGRWLRLAADPEGLAVVGGRGDIVWNDVTRFVCRTYTSRKRGTGMRYSVVAGRKAITWDMPDDADDDTLTENVRLCQLVASRTHLLLIEEGVVAPTWPMDVRAGLAVPHTVTDDSIKGTAPRARRLRRGIWRWLALAVLLLGLAASAAYGASTLFSYKLSQAPSPEAVLRALQGTTTAYYDALNLNDGNWPAGNLAASGAHADFAGDSYALTATDQPAVALMMGAPVAGAVGVTVSGLRGPGGAGIALRANSGGTAMLTFSVSANGRWQLARFDDAVGAAASVRVLASGPANAIRRGDVAENVLLVAPQGMAYVCYINGQYVGTVDVGGASTAGLPASGGVGVLASSGTSATFTAFTVYPRA